MDSNYLVALLAVVLAGLAFIVAVLQALLQYISASAARTKCSRSAIGSAHKLVEKSWSFLSWRWKYRYPILQWNLVELFPVMKSAEDAEDKLLDQIDPNDKLTLRPFEREDKVNNWWHVLTETSIALVNKTDEFANISDLSPREALRYIWYRVRHPYKRIEAPRASWAQLLLALGVYDVKPLTLHLADADTAPSSLDIPLQRVKLRQLGSIAFVLGFERVSIDIPNREFRAYSPYGSITTEEVQVLGKVIRFEGDMWQLYGLHSRCSRQWIIRGAGHITGKLGFGRYIASGLFCNIAILGRVIPMECGRRHHQGLVNRASRSRYTHTYVEGPILLEACDLRKTYQTALRERAEKNPDLLTGGSPGSRLLRAHWKPEDSTSQSIAGNSGLESLILADCNILPKEDLLSCFAKWQATTGSTIPTLLAAACFNSLSGIVMAFPVRALLVNILPWVRHLSSEITAIEPRPFVLSTRFSQNIARGDIDVLWENSQFLLCSSDFGSADGISGWGITNLEYLFDGLPQKLRKEIVPDGNGGEARAVICPEAYKLLQEFNPQQWGRETTEHSFVMAKQIRSINILWIQILVLDMAIQHTISDGWNFVSIKPAKRSKFQDDSWGKLEAAVVPSIVKSWRPNDPKISYTSDIEREQTEDMRFPPLRRHESPKNHDRGVTLPEKSRTESESDSDNDKDGDHHHLSVPSVRQGEERMSSVSRDETLTLDDTGSAEASSTDATPTFKPWELAHHLCENRDVFSSVGEPALRREKCEKLGNLLQLRAIFMIAFLALHPDSSDVYVTEGEDIEMPMA